MQSGRPIVLSICEWGKAKPWLWGKDAGGNLWRTTDDINDVWERQGNGLTEAVAQMGSGGHTRSAGWVGVVRGAGTLERS